MKFNNNFFKETSSLAKVFSFVMFVIYAVFLVLLICRSFLSVELTDEVHGIASIYNIFIGKVPFMTSWDYHTGWCLEVPLFTLYALIYPDLEGIILFFRLVYIVFSGANLAVITYILQKRFHNKNICFFIFPSLFYVSFSMFHISYNSFTVNMLLLISTLLFIEGKKLSYFVSGILMCIACITYPTLVILAIFMAVYILFTGGRGGLCYQKTAYYILGGVITAAIFFLWIFSKGSIELFVSALNGMLTSPHEKTKGAINVTFLTEVFYKRIQVYITHISVKFLGIYFICLVAISLIRKKEKVFWNIFLLFAFLIANTCVSVNMIGYLMAGDFAALILFVCFLGKRFWKKYLLFFIMLFSYILTYCVTSDNRDIFAAFISAGQMIFFIIGLILSDQEIMPHKYIAILTMTVLSLSGLMCVYDYVYGDKPIKELTVQVEEGIYKGLYTEQGRKQFVEKAERMLKEEINKEDQICTVTCAPWAYLMANANICSPQTWDPQFLYKGYTSATPLLDYFEIMEEIPDVLIATDMDVKDFYENSKYEVNEFINRNYELYHREEIEGVTIYLWRKTESA